jgi:hypothetical protein
MVGQAGLVEGLKGLRGLGLREAADRAKHHLPLALHMAANKHGPLWCEGQGVADEPAEMLP